MEWDKIYGEIRRLNWFILLIVSLISYFLMGHSLTLGIILGGFVIIANFSVLQHTIRRAFTPEGVMFTGKIFIIFKYYFRLLALGAVIFFLLKRGWVDPVGLAIGLSIVVISIISLGVKRALRINTGEATS